MRCLILGGGGFLGSHLADGLLSRGNQVRLFERPAFSRNNVSHLLGQLEVIEGSLEDSADIERAMAGVDAIFHLACTTVPATSNEDPRADLLSNVLPTIRILDGVRRHPECRIVFFSSGGTVYGIPERIPISESHPTNPISAYGIHKLAIEKYLFLYHHLYRVDARVLRISNAFGERQSPVSGQGAIAAFLHKALRRQVIEIWGDGSVVRDYIHVADVVRAASMLMDYDGEMHVFNIGSGVGRSISDVVAAIEQAVGHNIEALYSSSRALDVPANVLDISRAKTELDWTPGVVFEEGLRRTLEHMHEADEPEQH